ncbi:hypothetical protein F4780DRAFT_783691 [Xylariomycetidae sp. FL0641]|nr:hypothetical protein F4780DRAFT_783691 [Xylariomycetidae sp. FL0641]
MAAVIPDSMPYERACVLPPAFATATYDLFRPDCIALGKQTWDIPPHEDEVVFVPTVASSVGVSTIQLAVAAAMRSFEFRSKIPTMLPHLVLISLLLTATGLASPLQKEKNSMCFRDKGTYDVCDTMHSYIRCHEHNAMMVVDCRPSKKTYCQVVSDKGSCNGESPPALNSTILH